MGQSAVEVDEDGITRAHVKGWAGELIDLSRRNHALFHRPTKRSSLDLRAPDPLTLHRRLTEGSPLGFFIPPFSEVEDDAAADTTSQKAPRWTIERSLELAGPDEVVTDRTEGQDLQRTLTNLMRTSNQDWLDRAVRTLYVSFGQLGWTEDLDGRELVSSPLVYLPVTLKRGSTRQPFLLERTDDDPVLNPSLVMKLSESFGIDLMPLADRVADLDTMDEVIEEIEELVDDLGWAVEHAAALKRATFHKESMYRDLMENIDIIAAHPIVRSLAGVTDGSQEDPASGVAHESELDRVAPPEQAHVVLDADASQRRAVLAAAQGVSFVMDGPPGTGKSQTIVNMIAELIAAGRSVLFVSEKAAALEVVAKRLADVGLSDFLLELHSHKANRREVVQELDRSLRLHPQAVGGMNAAQRARLERRRTELNDYAEAVNIERAPLSRSVVWAAGRVAALMDAPELTLPDTDLLALDLATLEACLDDAQILAASWDRIQSEEFLWRDVENPQRPSAESARRVLDAVSAKLRELRRSSSEVGQWVGLPVIGTQEDVDAAIAWSKLFATRPDGVSALLLDMDDAARADIRSNIGDIRVAAKTVEDAEEKLESRYPGRWRDAPLPSPADVARAAEFLGAGIPRFGSTRAVTTRMLDDGAALTSEILLSIGRLRDDVKHVAQLCGADAATLTHEQAARLAEVASRAGSEHRPDPEWLRAKTSFAADEALTDLQRRQETSKAAWKRVSGILRPEAIDLDVKEAVRIHRNTKGRLARLGSEARSARKVLGEALRQDLRDVTDAQLSLAVRAWNAARDLRGAEQRHQPLVDRFQFNGVTDIPAAREALGLAMDIRRAGGDRFDPDVAALQFCGSRPEDPDLVTRAGDLFERLERLASDLERLEGLGVDIARNVNLLDLERRLTAALEALTALRPLLGPALEVRSSGASLADLEQDRKLADDAREAAEALLVRVGQVREQLSLRDLDQADGSVALAALADLETAILWADAARKLDVVTMDADLAVLIADSPLDGTEAEAIERERAEFAAACDDLRAFLGESASTKIEAALSGPFDEVEHVIASLRASADQLPEWWDHVDSRATLVDSGFQPLLDEAARGGIASTQIPAAVERALLSGWLEQVLGSDPRLSNLGAKKRQNQVEEFQRMDQELLADSAYRVIEACAGRLPRGGFGGAGLIRREANKKSRHLPVRTLLERTGPVVTRLKPCLMMSPLSVSQYIPSDWRFDVVVFDEASQIPPQDAINCIYRGDQLVIAGDDRQLPPTSFFELAGNDDFENDDDIVLDDFESVLGLAKASDALADLGLRWHYRSRHEDLITFSNHRFYEGELVTYPGATTTGSALGVVHHLVSDGVYHRGGRKDNPREAHRVAEIVADHVRNSPHLSIGVVALSSAQAEAIEDAVDRIRREDPKLDKAFRSDRLDGFFVKNLENVQGDDRDIIILSIGYGPDSTGRMTMNFGPMNQQGGWRRLNVAVTRARNRMDVVSSFPSDQLRVTGSGTSLATLKAYLEYAERGPQVLNALPAGSLGDAESPLEEEVLRTIRSWGYDAVPQVGSASYRIDIGIRDPNDPDRYILGVECDGAAYHSSKVARDRDRLRQQVLEGLGWQLHRVWGPAWFRNRPAAEKALRETIEAALESVADAAPQTMPTSAQSGNGRVEVQHKEMDPDERPAWAKPYRAFDVHRQIRLNPTSSQGSKKLKEVVTAVIEMEAPMHTMRLNEVVAAVFSSYPSVTVEHAVAEVLRRMPRSSPIESGKDDFVRLLDSPVEVRYPADEETRRPIYRIAPEEIELAIVHLLDDLLAAEPDELERAVRTLFGFKRLGPRIAEAIAEAIKSLERDGHLRLDAQGRFVLS